MENRCGIFFLFIYNTYIESFAVAKEFRNVRFRFFFLPDPPPPAVFFVLAPKKKKENTLILNTRTA